MCSYTKISTLNLFKSFNFGAVIHPKEKRRKVAAILHENPMWDFEE